MITFARPEESRALRRRLGVPEESVLVVVSGGSMGSRSLNRAVAAAIGELAAIPRLYLVHGVGLKPSDHRLAQARSCALVWCPSSNHFLFGTTADVSSGVPPIR